MLEEEKSPATIEKYLRDVTKFLQWCCFKSPTKTIVLGYKQDLLKHYTVTTVNSVLASLNCFFGWQNLMHLKVKNIRVQSRPFFDTGTQLTKTEYLRLLTAAHNKKNDRLFYLLQTICATGIRVSELKFISVSSIESGYATVWCKGKVRTVILPDSLCSMLSAYCKEQRIQSGSIFVTRTGNPVDRSNIWSEMKQLCKVARVEHQKVFPHNLRHLFARTYYSHEQDVVRLADILGHSNINTTRIYTIENGEIHRNRIQNLGLIHMPDNSTT